MLYIGRTPLFAHARASEGVGWVAPVAGIAETAQNQRCEGTEGEATKLLLGPMLRYVDSQRATIWVETDEACEVEVLNFFAHTFEVAGHHYAVVAIDGLERGQTYPYTVSLDSERVWPEAESAYPPSAIRTTAAGETEPVVSFLGVASGRIYRIASAIHPSAFARRLPVRGR